MLRFLKWLMATIIPVLLVSAANGADDSLHILQPDNIDRLRLDFNASRSKVRLVFMLSPT
jgi:hypothetical protein